MSRDALRPTHAVAPTAGTSRSGRAMALAAADVVGMDSVTDPDTGRTRISRTQWDALCALIGADPATGLPLPTDGGAS
jgi:hypothetical protein